MSPRYIVNGRLCISKYSFSHVITFLCARRLLRIISLQPTGVSREGLPITPLDEAKTTFTDEGVGFTVECQTLDNIAAAEHILETSLPQKKKVNVAATYTIPRGNLIVNEQGKPNSLSQEQAQTLSLALSGASLFVGGKAGTGKSFVLREIVRVMKLSGLDVAVTASTGVAALNIGGNTFHSVLGVPVWQDDDTDRSDRVHCLQDLLPNRGKFSYNMKALSQFDVIIVDEVSLLHGGYLEALEHTARHAEGKNPRKPFGGIQVILFGDFMQLMPFRFRRGVFSGPENPRSATKSRDRLTCSCVARESDVVSQYAILNDTLRRLRKESTHKTTRRRYCVAHYSGLPMYESYAFRNYLIHLQLIESVRHRVDVDFLRDLNLLRVGILTHRLSRSSILNREETSAIRLFATRRSAKAYNQKHILGLSGREVNFKSHIILLPVNENNLSDSLINTKCTSHHRAHQRFFSEVSILHFAARSFIFGQHRYRSRKSGTDHWHRNRVCPMSYSEAHYIIRELCQSNSLDPERFFIYVLPFACRYFSNIQSIAVRSIGDSKREAEIQLNLLLSSVNDRMRWGIFLGNPGAIDTGFVLFSAPRWVLIRLESCTARKFVSRLKPHFQRQFQDSRQDELITQCKKLRIGCRVMLLRNLNTQYVNGSLGSIVDFAPLSACTHLLPQEMKTLLPRNHLAFFFSVMKRKRHHGDVFRSDLGNLDGKAIFKENVKVLPLKSIAEQQKLLPSKASTLIDHLQLPLVKMDSNGAVVAIPWISLPFDSSMSEGFFSTCVVCMPLTPAYAFTVHKIQGVTFDHPVLFDGAGMFPCDHLIYVVASRVRRFSQFRCVNLSPQMVTVHMPSLQFSECLPSICTATAVWDAWTGRLNVSEDVNIKGNGLFLPNWRSSPPYTC